MAQSHRRLEIHEGTRVQSQQSNLTGGGSPIDEHEREGLSPIFVVVLVRQDDEPRGVLR